MVPFERVVAELRSLYQRAGCDEPPASSSVAHARLSSSARETVLARYDELLATAAAMVGAACPPQPFSAGDRLWLEDALAGLGLHVQAPSSQG